MNVTQGEPLETDVAGIGCRSELPKRWASQLHRRPITHGLRVLFVLCASKSLPVTASRGGAVICTVERTPPRSRCPSRHKRALKNKCGPRSAIAARRAAFRKVFAIRCSLFRFRYSGRVRAAIQIFRVRSEIILVGGLVGRRSARGRGEEKGASMMRCSSTRCARASGECGPRGFWGGWELGTGLFRWAPTPNARSKSREEHRKIPNRFQP